MTNLGVPSSRVIARRAQARRGNLMQHPVNPPRLPHDIVHFPFSTCRAAAYNGVPASSGGLRHRAASSATKSSKSREISLSAQSLPL